MFKFYTDELKANVITVTTCIGLGPVFTMLIYTDENIFAKCMIGNIISCSIYIIIFLLFMCSTIDRCCECCVLYSKPFTGYSLGSWVHALTAILCICCGALFTSAIYPSNNCSTKCMIGNMIAWGSLMIIILIISCGYCCGCLGSQNEEEGSNAAHV